MKTYRALAYKELLASKITSVLILIAVILSTMMTTAIGQSLGILSAMRDQQAIALNGNRYATFVQMDQAQVDKIRADPRISYAGVSVSVGTVELNRILTLGLNEYWGDSLSAYPSLSQVEEGRLPERPMEIALPEDVLQMLGFSGDVGDTISLAASKALRHGVQTSDFSYTGQFTLTGILRSNYLGYSAGVVQGIVGKGTAEALLPPDYLYYNVDIRTKEKAAFQETMDDLVETLKVPELDTLYNVTYLNAKGISFDEESADTEEDGDGFSLLAVAGLLVGGLILLAAGLVIYNILNISVSRRTEQYGTLRAIGGEKRQMYTVVSLEILLLCAVGMPVGLGLGLLSATGILTAATSLLSPELFLAQDTAMLQQLIQENQGGKGLFLFLSVFSTLSFAGVAAIPAARAAARVSPVVSMAGPVVVGKRKNRSTRKIHCFESYYARLNLKRHRGRTVITVLSLVMSITVFLALQGFVSLLNAAGTEQEHLGDYSVVNETVGFTPEELKKLQEDSNVENVAAMQFSLYPLDEQNRPVGIALDRAMQPGETFQVVGLNKLYLKEFFGDRLSEADLSAIENGTGCIVRNPIAVSVGEGDSLPSTRYTVGSAITVAGKALTVLETMDDYDGYLSVGNSGFTNGVQVIVIDQLYPVLTGRDTYAELLPLLTEGADRKAFDQVLEKFCQEIPGTMSVSYEQTDQQLEESFAQIHLLAWGLILFVGLIGVLNIINTVYTNIHTRKKEIGTQRAIGMSLKSLYKTFLWEGAYYGLLAAVIGGMAGSFCAMVIQGAQTGTVTLGTPPWLPLLEAAGVSVAVCLLATGIPLRQIARLSIVDAIETVE